MGLTLRPATTADVEQCSRICHTAFKPLAEAHNFPPDFPAPEDPYLPSILA